MRGQRGYMVRTWQLLTVAEAGRVWRPHEAWTFRCGPDCGTRRSSCKEQGVSKPSEPPGSMNRSASLVKIGQCLRKTPPATWANSAWHAAWCSSCRRWHRVCRSGWSGRDRLRPRNGSSSQPSSLDADKWSPAHQPLDRREADHLAIASEARSITAASRSEVPCPLRTWSASITEPGVPMIRKSLHCQRA